MADFFHKVDDFLRGKGAFAPDAPFGGRVRLLLAFVLIFGGLYGLVMGTYSGCETGRWALLLYGGIKVPMLLLVTFLICLPAFFVINSLVGLRDDFTRALHGIVGTQACVTLVLAALAPVTLLVYVSYNDYTIALLFNGLVFFIGTLSAHRVVKRYYAPLILRNARHRVMLRLWFTLYIFVGIQMAWLLRPFVGDPNAPVQFFRVDAFQGNVYVVIVKLIGRLAGRVFLGE
jgi:hypothetical protein